MTVKELIELLQKEDKNDLVVLSGDSEGNYFNQVYTISKAVYDDNEISIRELTPELEDRGYSEEDLCHSENCRNCVVIWP
jgi:hypothetical protein